MVTRKTNAEAIVRAALQLFRLKGYSTTSMADIGRECNLLKGSIYHYFPGKRAIAMEVIDYINERFAEEVFPIAYQDRLPAAERLTTMMAAVERQFSLYPGGCVIHNLAVEAGNEPDFLPGVRRYFDAWTEALTHLFGDAYDERQARELALDAVARTQGALLMCSVFQSRQPLELTDRMLSELLGRSCDN